MQRGRRDFGGDLAGKMRPFFALVSLGLFESNRLLSHSLSRVEPRWRHLSIGVQLSNRKAFRESLEVSSGAHCRLFVGGDRWSLSSMSFQRVSLNSSSQISKISHRNRISTCALISRSYLMTNRNTNARNSGQKSSGGSSTKSQAAHTMAASSSSAERSRAAQQLSNSRSSQQKSENGRQGGQSRRR